MGNIGSQNGQLKYKPANAEDLQWPHSFPRTQPRFQQNQMKVLPDKTPKIRLRHTENGELLHNKGTLTGRQMHSRLGETREIQKCESEPHLHRLVNTRHQDSFESDKEKKFRKKYKAPPPPNQGNKLESNHEYWENRKETPPKPRLFKTKIESERKRSTPDYQEKSDYFQSSHKNVTGRGETENSSGPSSHRLSLPVLNAPAWDFQGELKEATRRLRRIRADDSDDNLPPREPLSEENDKRNKLKTLDHHIDRTDLIKLKNSNLRQLKQLRKDEGHSYIRNDTSGPDSPAEEAPPPKIKETKTEPPKLFYFGMTSSHKGIPISGNDAKSGKKNFEDSESSGDQKKDTYDHSDQELRRRKSKRTSETTSRFPPVSSTKEYKYSSEENEEPTRVFSIFPVRSTSNDRSRSGDSGISGDGSPAVYEDSSEPLMNSKDNSQSLPLILGWTPQQDLGDDTSFEEESFTAGDYADNFDVQSNQRHVFSLSLPRDHHLASYVSENVTETNFEKIKRSVSGILSTMHKKEAESSPENEKGNWFLNKSCSDLISPPAPLSSYSKTSEELEDFLSRSTKLNTGRIMYLPKADRPARPRRYETRNKQKYARDDKLERPAFANKQNLNETKSKQVPESLQDSPVMSDRKNFKKKPKRFTFQSTIRQIERRRIAEKLSREAEKKEQQRLRELEVMQKVEREFQRKRAREKVNIKQQLSRYSYENTLLDNSSPDSKHDYDSAVGELQARSEPDGAVSSSPTSSLSQLDNKRDQKNYREKDHMDFVNNNREYKSFSDNSDDNRSKSIMQTKVLSEYRQPQREYRDYQTSKKHLPDGADRQTTVHPKVTYKMPKSKGTSRYDTNNYRKDFAYGIKTKSETSWHQQPAPTKNPPNDYYSQFGPLTRF
ncbi:uncharacterized protein LOC123322120 [Coccinella septempunctata]|uniref:uncharacterized protein LOC123322120 n=1 Tax=Coccinella septempunctata TaxID=41139 RepID=UPI001D08A479|nr:uncharacterized protein LOC123322120 [Coccinella septempunctata]XP_044765899.1 uncharacterized protein LOC123322120 [Coccinella septempunctata]